MKNRKGFTLIELLAVIVILIIITLIAIPIVQNVIENSKKNSLIASTKIAVKAIESFCLQNNANGKYIWDKNENGFVLSNQYIVKIKGKFDNESYIMTNNCKASEVYTLYKKYIIDNKNYLVSETDNISEERNEFFEASYGENCNFYGNEDICENIYEKYVY